MKAIIDATDHAGYMIRVYDEKGALCDIHVVEEVEVIDGYPADHEGMPGRYVCRPEYDC